MLSGVKKIILILLIVGMGWSGLSAGFGTYATFSSRAVMTGVFKAGNFDLEAAEARGGSTADLRADQTANDGAKILALGGVSDSSSAGPQTGNAALAAATVLGQTGEAEATTTVESVSDQPPNP
jgi:hypothetical protein